MALWLIFILAGIAIINGSLRFARYKFGLSYLAFLTIIYFIIISKIIFPIFNANGFEQLSRYSHLGNNFVEIFKTFITHPKLIFSLIFENFTGNPFFNGIKTELHYVVLLSGGWLFFFRPKFLIFLIPIYAQKLLSNDVALWGINDHYSIEFVPIISLALIYWINGINLKRVQIIAICCAALTIITTISAIDSRTSPGYKAINNRFYSAQHFTQNFDVTKAHAKLNEFSSNLSISALSPIVPHIAMRDVIYQFPYGLDKVDKIVVFKEAENYYPLDKNQFNEKISELVVSENWEIEYDENNLLILSKIIR